VRSAQQATAVALVTITAAAFTPGLPWYAAPVGLGFAALAAWDRHWIWSALGATLFWTAAGAGPAGAFVLAAAVGLGALRWRTLSTVVIATGLALAVKQHAAATQLPEALAVVPWLLVTSVGSAGAVSAARGGRREALGLALASAVVLARLALVWSVDGAARLVAAERLNAVPLVYDALAADADLPLAAALVRAAPDRDAAALRFGWARALDLGWRPARAEGVVVPVARSLEARGRGGEALRLLARHPRVGEVDALRALLERLLEVPVRWRGAALGPTLPGGFPTDLVFDTNAWAAVEFTATQALSGLMIDGEGAAYEGAAVLEVRLDAREPVSWALDGPATLVLAGPLAPGPHRVGVRFVNDRVDAGGDRNARVLRVRTGAAPPG
jgi:hypothetical protein